MRSSSLVQFFFHLGFEPVTRRIDLLLAISIMKSYENISLEFVHA
jgi:hypothetical protein